MSWAFARIADTKRKESDHKETERKETERKTGRTLAMTVSSIIAIKGRDVVTSQSHHTLQDIARILGERRIGAVLITAADGSIKGIISERDIVQAPSGQFFQPLEQYPARI